MSRKKILVVSLLVMAVYLSACVPVDVESDLSEEDAGRNSFSNRTGVTDIDLVLDVVESGDVEALRRLLRFNLVACTTMDGLGGPPKCREGEIEGTQVYVFPFLGGEGSFLYKEYIDTWQGMDAPHLYAVYRNSKNVYSDEYFPAGEYSILLLSDDDRPGTILRVSDGEIVRIDMAFDTSTDGLSAILDRDAADIIFAP